MDNKGGRGTQMSVEEKIVLHKLFSAPDEPVVA